MRALEEDNFITKKGEKITWLRQNWLRKSQRKRMLPR